MQDTELRIWLLDHLKKVLATAREEDANKVLRYLEFNPVLSSAPLADLCWAICYLLWKKDMTP